MEKSLQKISVLIIEDQELMIDGLKAMLKQEADIEIIGYSLSALEAENLSKKLRPDIILMDFDFPQKDTDGIKTAAKILAQSKEHRPQIIMLTNYDERALIHEAYRTGIKGYIPKNASKNSLVTAIKSVFEGRFYFDEVLDILIPETKTDKPWPAASADQKTSYYPLTKREVDVAVLAAAGKSRKIVASELFISHNTVDTHFKNIFAKLEVRNVAGLINWLVRKKLI